MSDESKPMAGWGCVDGSLTHFRRGSLTLCGIQLTTNHLKNWSPLVVQLSDPQLCRGCLRAAEAGAAGKGEASDSGVAGSAVAVSLGLVVDAFNAVTKERDEALAKVKELEERLKTYQKASEPLTWKEVEAAINPMTLNVKGSKDAVWLGLLEELSSKFKHIYKHAALPEGGGSLQFRKEALQDLKTVQAFLEDYLRVLKPVLDGLVNSQRLLASQDDSLR